jgi:hypothetical protein
MKHKEFKTRTELKSLTQSIKCAEMECASLRMLSECLGGSSMRLGVPFIAPRQLGVVVDQQGRLSLPSVGWHTGQSGAPPVSHWDGPVQISFLFWRRRPLQIRGSWHTGHCPVHTGQFGAPCRPLARATRRSRIAWPTIVLAAVGSPDSPVHHRTVRWIIVVRRQILLRAACSPESNLHHRTLSGAPPDSPMC